jgi:predicted CoA-binding protein
MTKIARKTIDDFLSLRRLAMVGVSRDEKDFSRTLFTELHNRGYDLVPVNQLHNRGYDLVPVNPNAEQIDGRPCFDRLQDITPAVEGALVLTQPTITENVVRDCAEAGIGMVWIQSPGGAGGSVSPAAVDFCRENGIEVVPGACVFMFLPETAVPHKIHGFILKIIGKYPK